MCGGTLCHPCFQSSVLGLSPRVRGNQRECLSNAQSIGVYPRVCGGTNRVVAAQSFKTGLSPRVRGNLSISPTDHIRLGSIPACAGEPSIGGGIAVAGTVYPRVCGGTNDKPNRFAYARGLSPRVRGNLHSDVRPAGRDRSIPACAGEPDRSSGSTLYSKVYPRVCGGTVLSNVPRPGNLGLSPRVRGNRRRPLRYSRDRRSIPACAGEPVVGDADDRIVKVYPRVCGGTRSPASRCRRRIGLSPRVRGNHHQHRAAGRRPGSIPACAGEP